MSKMKRVFSFVLSFGVRGVLSVVALAAAAAAQQPTTTPQPAQSPQTAPSSSSPQPAQPPSAAECAELPALKRRVDQAEGRLRDWPNLRRYREANAQLAPPAKGETRVVFMGDSITDLWSRPGYGGFFPGKPYVNRGISGQTTPQMLIRFRPDVIALRPKVVVILAGTNDLAAVTGPTTLAAVEDNLAAMAELAHANGIRVVLASLLPVSDYEHGRDGTQIVRTKDRPPAQINELNDWMKQYAARNGHTYLDYHTAVADEHDMLRDDLSDDGLHVTAKGYAVMAPLAEAAIAAALKKH